MYVNVPSSILYFAYLYTLINCQQMHILKDNILLFSKVLILKHLCEYK